MRKSKLSEEALLGKFGLYLSQFTHFYESGSVYRLAGVQAWIKMPTENKDLVLFFFSPSNQKNVPECVENPPREEYVSEQKCCQQSVKSRFQLKIGSDTLHEAHSVGSSSQKDKVVERQLPRHVVETCDYKS